MQKALSLYLRQGFLMGIGCFQAYKFSARGRGVTFLMGIVYCLDLSQLSSRAVCSDVAFLETARV